jgi:DNA-binding MarR family transcriptional regulator
VTHACAGWGARPPGGGARGSGRSRTDGQVDLQVFLLIFYGAVMASEPADRQQQPGTPGEPRPEQVATALAGVVARLNRRLRTASPDSLLTPSQRSVLARLGTDGPATTAALARAEHVRPQSMRATLQVLEERLLVSRAPDPGDGRQSVMSITPAGRRTLADVRAAKHGWLSATIAERLDASERRTLAEATDLLERLVGE